MATRTQLEAEKPFHDYHGMENPLRAIGFQADAIERATGISVVRLNVGNPTGPTLAASNQSMGQYFDERTLYNGYGDLAGVPSLRWGIAKAITKIARLPEGTFDMNGTFLVPGGTGGLNVALSIFKNPAILVSDPFYPPWEPISKRNGGTIYPFKMDAEDDFLLNETKIEKAITEATAKNPKRNVVLMYHYPHNPTGKTLTEADAQKVAGVLNTLVAKHPNLSLIQEDLYLGTTRSDLGIYTPLPYLTKESMLRTIVIHSPSKEGHGQDRGAILATVSPVMAKFLRGAVSFDTLGISTAAAIGTLRTLVDIAKGIDPRKVEDDGKLTESHRYTTADYYQARINIITDAFLDLEKALKLDNGAKILPLGAPEGTYYLFPKLAFMKGMQIPDAFNDVFEQAVGEGKLKKTKKLVDVGGHKERHYIIETTRDIQLMLAHAYKIGLRPTTTAPGEIFTKDNDNMVIRLAAVDKNLDNLKDAANTLRGVIGKVMEQRIREQNDGKSSEEVLKVHVREFAELAHQHDATTKFAREIRQVENDAIKAAEAPSPMPAGDAPLANVDDFRSERAGLTNAPELDFIHTPESKFDPLTDPERVSDYHKEKHTERNHALLERSKSEERNQVIPRSMLLTSTDDDHFTITIPFDATAETRKRIAYDTLNLIREKYDVSSEVGLDLKGNIIITLGQDGPKTAEESTTGRNISREDMDAAQNDLREHLKQEMAYRAANPVAKAMAI